MKAKPKSRIGEDNPLDAYDTSRPAPEAAPRPGKPGKGAPESKAGRTRTNGKPAPKTPPAPVREPTKEPATFHLSPVLMDRVRNAVYACSGPPLRLTLAGFVESSLRMALEELEKSQNKGKPFPRRGEELRGGRPLRS